MVYEPKGGTERGDDGATEGSLDRREQGWQGAEPNDASRANLDRWRGDHLNGGSLTADLDGPVKPSFEHERFRVFTRSEAQKSTFVPCQEQKYALRLDAFGTWSNSCKISDSAPRPRIRI